MKNYFIIHGFMGSNIENWFPWFKQKVDAQNSLCTIPQFPIYGGTIIALKCGKSC